MVRRAFVSQECPLPKTPQVHSPIRVGNESSSNVATASVRPFQNHLFSADFQSYIYAKGMTDYSGTSIPLDEAWRKFGEWKGNGREIGVIFYGCSGTSLYMIGVVESARDGKLFLKGDGARASFNLQQATFTYGPIQTWPKWPTPPIVEVIAVQAQLENGDWLALAEGLRPESPPPRALPE